MENIKSKRTVVLFQTPNKRKKIECSENSL